MSTGSSKSPLWAYFTVDANDITRAICKLCDIKISRGGQTARSFTTSGLSNHLKNKHQTEFKKCQEESERKRKSEDSQEKDQSHIVKLPKQVQVQQTLQGCINKTLLWDLDHPKAMAMHYRIGEMIATDNQPFQIVENVGFIRVLNTAEPKYKIPGRKYFREKVVPDIHSRVCDSIQTQLKDAESICLTSDIWTCNNTNESFISLSGHWITSNFIHTSVVLHAKHFPGSHTGENIAEMITTMIDKWNIKKDSIHLLIRDNGSNIVSGVKSAGIASEGCFIHTLQLAIHDAVLSQRAVSDIITNCRRIVTHFNHSPLACSNLKKIQQDLQVPEHKLIQDVSTRWNSTYYMLQRLHEQKRAIGVYGSEHDIPTLSAHQWDLVEKVLRLLQPFEEFTLQASKDTASISIVIPYIATLLSYLEKKENDQGVQTMKSELKLAIKRRFQNLEINNKYFVATVLDPRFKLAFITKTLHKDVKTWLSKTLNDGQKVGCQAEGNLERPSTSEGTLRKEIHEDIWECFSEIASGSDSSNKDEGVEQRNEEVQNYFTNNLIPRKEDPLQWWKKHQSVYPGLSKLARCYLAAPASSVYSERIFSEAGQIYDSDRSRLLPRNAEMLLFLHHNLPLLNYKY